MAMNTKRFWELCETYSSLIGRVNIYNSPEHGDKAALKRVHKTLREVLGMRDVDRLHREAAEVQLLWRTEQRGAFATDDEQRAAREKRQQAQADYRKYCDDLYRLKFPSPNEDPVRLQRIAALREQIDYLKKEFDAEKQRGEQIQAEVNESKTRLAALKAAVGFALEAYEAIRISE